MRASGRKLYLTRENGIDGVSGTACEIAASKMTISFEVTDHPLNGRSTAQRLMMQNTSRFCPEIKTRRGMSVSVTAGPYQHSRVISRSQCSGVSAALTQGVPIIAII